MNEKDLKLNFIVLYGILSCCITLHCIVLYCVALYCIVLYCNVQYRMSFCD